MAYPTHVGTDFLLVDGLETVSVWRPSIEGVVLPLASGVRALRRQDEYGPVTYGSGVQGTSRKVRWHLYAADLPVGTILRREDEVRDASGKRWEVLSATTAAARTRWVLQAVEVVT